MNPWLLATVAVLYASIAIQYIINGRPWMCLVFVGYAIAQIGFVIDAIKYTPGR